MGDDEEFLSQPGLWIVDDDEDPVPSIESPFADESYSDPVIHGLDNVMSELESLINDQIINDPFRDLDVDALVIGFESLDWLLVPPIMIHFEVHAAWI